MIKIFYRSIGLILAALLIFGSWSKARAGSSLITVNPIVVNDYLSNPGIGWQNNDSKVVLPETVIYPNRSTISWKILNPSEGVYYWTPLDTQLNQAIAAGKQLSFRVYTMIGESYGGHAVPGWVITKGATILPSGEPDYSNCVYQQEWGNFVNALIQRYDGNPNIAFIDISGYGNFNEWSWQNQTQWDSTWDANYKAGKASSSTMTTLDSQARRRLADMFIGGSFATHQCKSGSTTKTVSYSYVGAQRTQLVMPYAGISQSTQYVVNKRSDVGFRYDCLGRANTYLTSSEVMGIWRTAPVVYEFCSSDQFNLTTASNDLIATHGSIVHNNSTTQSAQAIQDLMRNVGYRYVLTQAKFNNPIQGQLTVSMIWRNTGTAPSYPKMGQDFKLHLYLVDQQNNVAADFPVNTDVSKWLPGAEIPIDVAFNLPSGIALKTYSLKTSIVDQRTGKPIQLAFQGADNKGMYLIAQADVASVGTATPVTPSPTPTSTFTLTAPSTFTSTATATSVPPTATFTSTASSTPTSIPPTVTSTFTASPTFTPVQPTATFTFTASPPFTSTSTTTFTPIPPSATFTFTASPTSTLTASATPSPTFTPIPPTATFTFTASPTATSIIIPASDPTETATATSTVIPSDTPVSAAPTFTPKATQTTSGETIYNDKNRAFKYSSGWKNVESKKAYEKSYKVTGRNKASVTFRFRGQSFSLLYTSGPNYGKIEIYVDGKLVNALDQKSAQVQYQQRWDFTGRLAKGPHTIKIIFVGPSKTQSTLDAIIVH